MTRPQPSLTALLPAPSRPVPLHDAAATRALEHQAQAALPPHTLMARAGLAVARLAVAAWPGETRAHVFAGPGNNGGDALLAAAHLHRLGWSVQAQLLADERQLPDDACWALARCRKAGVTVQTGLPARVDAGVLLDGLLGLGASRAPDGLLAAAIGLLARHPARVLAIDLPSGLDGDRGTPLGTQAVTAAHTLSLLTLKPGLFTALGRDHAGRIWLDRLGVPPPASPVTLSAAAGAAAMARDTHARHKGSFGDVAVIGGAPGMAGAARLAACAALAAGAGRVFVAPLDDLRLSVDTGRPELMWRDAAELTTPDRLDTLTVVCGCGGGAAVAGLLPAVLAHAARLVLDADALNAIAADPALRRRLQARSGHGRPSILTPHPLEAARLLGQDAAQVQADRLSAARSLAADLGCVVVLKGSGSLIAAPDGSLQLNPTGNARLATAGTGDVLAGWIGGLWARGGDAGTVAGSAVYRHGWAAEQAPGQGPLLAGDLIVAMQALA